LTLTFDLLILNLTRELYATFVLFWPVYSVFCSQDRDRHGTDRVERAAVEEGSVVSGVSKLTPEAAGEAPGGKLFPVVPGPYLPASRDRIKPSLQPYARNVHNATQRKCLALSPT